MWKSSHAVKISPKWIICEWLCVITKIISESNTFNVQWRNDKEIEDDKKLILKIRRETI